MRFFIVYFELTPSNSLFPLQNMPLYKLLHGIICEYFKNMLITFTIGYKYA